MYNVRVTYSIWRICGEDRYKKLLERKSFFSKYLKPLFVVVVVVSIYLLANTRFDASHSSTLVDICTSTYAFRICMPPCPPIVFAYTRPSMRTLANTFHLYVIWCVGKTQNAATSTDVNVICVKQTSSTHGNNIAFKIYFK